MGIIRKSMSMSTLGAVDFRSDKERTAAYTKGARKQAKKQTKLMKDQGREQAKLMESQMEQQRLQSAALLAQSAPVLPAPVRSQSQPTGWYPDQQNPSLVRWFDGAQWTEQTQPRQ